MNFVSARRDHRPFAMGSALIAFAFVALLAFAARAQAATENIYWDNYSANNVSFADITGSGGGLLNLTGASILNPEGMAYDTATNRLFVASAGETGNPGAIVAINLNGSGASAFGAPGAPVENPEGIAVDPVNQTLYWVNTKGNGSISWARLDGSVGGTLNTTGATLEKPYKLAVDPVHGRVYWINEKPTPETISFANADNTGGGGDLNLTGATPPESSRSLVVDPAGGRIYWLTATKISFASLAGGGGGDVDLTGAPFNSPYGLALDPSLGRLYWANYSNGTVTTGALGFANATGGGVGGITPTTAPVNGPQDPVILKSPTGTGAPTVTRDSKERSKLNCSTGSWAADYAGSFVYQAPRTFAYQWTKNGKAIGGAVGPTYNAKSGGEYGCIVTAVNQAGSAVQTSSGVIGLKAAKLKLSTKKKAHGKPGQLVKFSIKATNQGDVQAKPKVCVKLPKSAKGELKAPKCKALGNLKGGGKKSAVLKIKLLPSAGGTYSVKFQVKGAPGKAAKAKIIVG